MNVAIIPARGGSQRIPRKNIRPFFGKPIIAYSIEVAGAASNQDGSALFSDVWVSTDDEEIAAVARTYGARVVARSQGVERDEVGTQMVMVDALAGIQKMTGTLPDAACCIYATCPMLTNADLERGALALYGWRCKYAMAVSCCPSLRDAGYFYWGHTQHFMNMDPLVSAATAVVPIPCERWADINTEDDWIDAGVKYARLMKMTLPHAPPMTATEVIARRQEKGWQP